MKYQFKKNSGMGMVEILVVIGLLGVVSLGTVTVMNNMFKGAAAAQKNANRTDTMKAISTALSNKNICKEVLGAGTRTIPAAWTTGTSAAQAVTTIKIGNDVVAQVGTAINDIQMTQMRLEMISGPYPVLFNVAAPGANPNLKNYRRYFTKLIVSPIKVGGDKNNLGGDAFKDNEFRIAVLVRDTNIIEDCFGGMDESDVNALCERGFDGQYDESRFPWCTPVNISIGIPRDQLPAQFPRFAVYEKQNTATTDWDLTMGLYGNGLASGNGPGLWFVRNPTTSITPNGNLAVIGYSGRAGAYGTGTKVTDFSMRNLSTTGDTYLTTADVILKVDQVNQKITSNRGVEISTPTAGTTVPTLSVNSESSQGNIVVSGASDAGQTYSAIYLAAASPSTVFNNSWVIAHKAPTSGNNDSLHIARWVNGTMTAGIAVTPNLNVGINNNIPQEKLDVGGNMVASGNIRANGNISAGGTVSAASDRRLKKDIIATTDNLKRLLSLQPVSYVWKNDIEAHKHLGFVAQEVQVVIPEAVSHINANTLGISAMDILSVVVGAIKELYVQVMELMKANQNTHSEMTELREVINQLQEKQKQLEMQNDSLQRDLNELKRKQN